MVGYLYDGCAITHKIDRKDNDSSDRSAIGESRKCGPNGRKWQMGTGLEGIWQMVDSISIHRVVANEGLDVDDGKWETGICGGDAKFWTERDTKS